MTVYRIMMLALAVAAGGYSYLLSQRILKFCGFDTKKPFFKIINLILAFIAAVCCTNIWTTQAMAVLHVLGVSLLLDAAALAIRVLFRKKQTAGFYRKCSRIYQCGLLPFVITGAVFVYGFVNMGHVTKTEYSVKTEKDTGNYKIALITDTHYATIQDTELLTEKISEINDQRPDIVILGGDIVEENTSKEDMREVFKSLGGINSKYGIYYVYGNHDRQPYTDDRTYTDEELGNAIKENGVTVLEDSYIEIENNIIVAGRGDAAWGDGLGRASTQEILQDADRDKFIIIVDHQPIEAAENDGYGVDLQLSGHTHAGQIWPVGILSELTGILNYGEYQMGECRVIVSSGFTGWGYPIRTEERCEYVMINISSQTE